MVETFEGQIPYSDNMIEKGSAEENWQSEWTDISHVISVTGGVDDSGKCFRFEPTASMGQTVEPEEGTWAASGFRLRGHFLPGKDISSAADVKSQKICTVTYADGTTGRYVIPAKAFLWGVY